MSQTLKVTTLNVNRIEQSVRELQTVVLRMDSRATGNIRLKEIFKKGALTVIRTVVYLSNSCGYTNNRASNPFFVMRHAWRHRNFKLNARNEVN